MDLLQVDELGLTTQVIAKNMHGQTFVTHGNKIYSGKITS